MKNKDNSKDKQKALNNAFYCTIATSVITILFLIFLSSSYYITPLTVIEIIIFLSLGFLTKKGSFTASTFLLIAFVIDRIIAISNIASRLSAINGITWVVWTMFFWQFYYKAYLYLKNEEDQTKTIKNH